MFDTLRWETARALRRLMRAPGFSIAVVAFLGVGIASDITMLGVADSILFRPPAHVHAPDEVVDVRIRTYPDYADLRNQARSFSGIAAWYAPPRPYAITIGDRVLPVQQMLASASLFPTLGVAPLVGRFFDETDDRDGGSHVAVLGYDAWRRLFAGDRDVLGRTLRVAGDVYTIIGIAPRGFTGVALAQVDLFLPITTTKFDGARAALTSRDYSWLRVVARLAPETSMAQAQAEAKGIYRRANPDTAAHAWETAMLGGRFADVHPIMELRRELAAGNVPVALWSAGVASLVLLIACANVAGLQLARSVRTRRELAVRAALGASRARLVGAMVLEGSLLAVASGIVAMAIARAADSLVRRTILTDLAPVASPLDGRNLLLALALTAVVVLACALWPALRIAKGDLAREMSAGGRGSSSIHLRTRRVLLVSQLATSMVLLVGASLFVASLRNARAMDLGMSLDRVLMSDLDLAGAGYTTERARALVEPLLERLRRIPGVTSVALSDAGIQPGWISYGLSVPGRDSLPRVRANHASRGLSAVTSDYLAAVGTPILAGRDFAPSDRTDRVAIVSEALARLYWPNESPVGQCVHIPSASTPCTEIIGVAHNRRTAPGDTTQVLEVFVPLDSPAEPPQLAKLFPLTSVVLRVDANASGVASAAQRVLQELLPDAPSIRVRPVLSLYDRALRAWRLGAGMFTTFAAIALAMAVVGIYATLSYLMAQRRRELAIRIALGATPRDVGRLVIGDISRVLILGLVFGMCAAGLAARGLRALLFGITSLAPGVFAGSFVVLGLAAFAAMTPPILRAIRQDPTTALRVE